MLDLTVRSFSPQQGRSADPSGNLRQSRHAVAADAGWSIPLVTLRTFLDDILPTKVRHTRCKTGDVARRLLSRLTNDGTYSSEDERWFAFPEDPKDTPDEGAVFEGLSHIAQGIEAAFRAEFNLAGTVDPTARYDQDPNSAPKHMHRQTLSRPDGVFVLRDKKMASDEVLWIDVVACGEFKRKNTLSNLNDDVDKTLWSLHHIMREDPRRRFAYAFTVENRTMRLFYCDRSQYAVSEPFDFCSEPRYLIHFFVALMYASETDLGWDPTMKLVVVDKEPQYDITVHDKHGKQSVYRTLGVLSNIATFNLRGRGTRVWRAKRVKRGQVIGPDVAIRDNWLDNDREREAEVMERIIGDVPPDAQEDEDDGEHDPEQSRKWLRDHMLHVVTSGDVQINGKADLTRRIFSVKKFLIPQEDKSNKAMRKEESRMNSLQAEVKNHHHDVRDMYPTPQHDTREHSMKAHHRIVYKEVCVTLNEVKNLDDALWYIRETLMILEVIHSAGWVHRDISGGNILIHYPERDEGGTDTLAPERDSDPSPVVKIADLEYAKKLNGNDSEPHGLRTGTDAFMSIEVAGQVYQFRHLNTAASSSVAPKKPQKKGKKLRGQPAPPRQQTTPRDSTPHDVFSSGSTAVKSGWRYNPLHDIESLWWLANFFVFDKDLTLKPRSSAFSVPLRYQEPDQVRRRRLFHQYRFSTPLFHTLDLGERIKLLGASAHLTDAQDKLHPFLRGPFVAALETLRAGLVSYYCTAEVAVDRIDHTVAHGLYEQFYESLYDATALTRNAAFDTVVESLGKTIKKENITILDDDEQPGDGNDDGGNNVRDDEFEDA